MNTRLGLLAAIAFTALLVACASDAAAPASTPPAAIPTSEAATQVAPTTTAPSVAISTNTRAAFGDVECKRAADTLSEFTAAIADASTAPFVPERLDALQAQVAAARDVATADVATDLDLMLATLTTVVAHVHAAAWDPASAEALPVALVAAFEQARTPDFTAAMQRSGAWFGASCEVCEL